MKFGADYTCYHTSSGFSCIMIFRFHGSANFSWCWDYLISLCAVSGRGKKCILQLFIYLVSAVWDQRQISFILL
jgi:hypothetical protein